MGRFTQTAVVAMAVLGFGLLACKKGGGGANKEVKGSCDMRHGTESSGSSSMCLDFHKEPNARVRAICSPDKGYTLGTGACDRSTALGGCSKGTITNWYYSSSRHSSEADVKAECPDEFVAAK